MQDISDSIKDNGNLFYNIKVNDFSHHDLTKNRKCSRILYILHRVFIVLLNIK